MGLGIYRKAGESFYIGEDIKVTLRKANKGNAHLTVEAPDELKIHRDHERFTEDKESEK
jgi:carbon storage regulator CsrA